MKTPEQYFVENVRLPDVDDAGRALTSAEEAFLDKYLGVERERVLAEAKRLDPRGADVVSGIASESSSAEEHSDEKMRAQTEIRLVSFSLMGREYALPITVIQEVIRYVRPTKLPAAPSSIAGIINLRGRVTPLVSLRLLLGIPGEQEDRFIVVCRHRGLQIGLMINAVSTMYKADGADLEWNVEANVGVNAHLLLGLYKAGEKLISILSIDNLVQVVLQGGRTHA
ncbi:purine-binding chemotaxis protein CheW [Humidesulfovibrio mexicanus]|uniref:Purine-binding chemotaxis protein CheW n=1 Tax=Humidesulfovibrio mexicanus TaxID=147047 RepID=A0A238ZHY2_9BACT|nr:chemotaxis protein CheW [Humidesulfovibrio mexicanus]SNR82303.1 purine-binding chemotaxis protein CheW [Humidesulfovibrio mexicanus]